MNTFRTLRLIDKVRINLLLDDSFFINDYSSSELVFENMFVWNFKNQIEILWINDELGVIRSLEQDSKWLFFPPICRTKEEFIEGLTYIKDNFPDALVAGLSKQMMEGTLMKDGLYLYDDYFSEYIYNPCDLAQMKGGKYSRRRNQIAQFKKKYNYSFLPYEDQHFDLVQEFLSRYEQEGGAGEDFDAILYALKSRNCINLFCDLLLVNNSIVGLSIGTISVFNHAAILFEKNDLNFVGSGALLVQLTVAAHYQECRVLTRQEDLGLPQLRKAKFALNPIKKERKYSCLFDARTIELYHLYLESFEDSRDYVDFFFLHYYRPNYTFSIERDGVVASALHIIMKKMRYNNKIIDLPFIVAASTHKNYRRQGLMREVMNKTFDSLIKEGHIVVSLYPVNPDFYFDYGFIQYVFSRNIDLYPQSFECGLEQTNDAELLANMYNKCVDNYEGYVVRDENYYVKYMNSLWQDGYVFELIKKENEIVGYAARKDGDISEILLCEEQKPVHKDLDTSETFLPHPEGEIPTNMIRILNVFELLRSISFGEEETGAIRLKIVDRFVKINNTILSLFLLKKKLDVMVCEEYDLEIAIEDLTKVLFLGRGNEQLAFLFPKKKMVCFDKF